MLEMKRCARNNKGSGCLIQKYVDRLNDKQEHHFFYVLHL